MTTPPALTTAADDGTRGFPRDRFTVAIYGTFVVWGWLLYSFNPSVPLLAKDLDLTGAQAGLHGTAMAVGAIVSAALTPRLVRRLGRRTTLMVAGTTLVLGVTLLVLAPALVWTLSGVALLAAGGNTSVSAAQAGLAMHHGPRASAALTEANGVGSAIGLLGPSPWASPWASGGAGGPPWP
ncbi:MFS transporter [Cellulomonas soli]